MEMESGESVVLTIQQRVDILKDWETCSIENAAKKYNVHHATIWRIQQNATAIAIVANERKLEERRKGVRKPMYEELEQHLLVWCIERSAIGDVITDELVLQKAAELKKEFVDWSTVNLTRRWLQRFKRRHQGPLDRAYGKKATADDKNKNRDENINGKRTEKIDEPKNGQSDEDRATDEGDEEYGIKINQKERQELEAAFRRLERYRNRLPLSARFHLDGVKLTILGDATSKD